MSEGIRVTRKRGYTVIYHDLLPTGGALSARAWGLYVYLTGRPDGWQVRTSHLQTVFKEGRDAMRATLSELVDAGLMGRESYLDEGLQRTRYTLDVDAANARILPETGFQGPGNPSQVSKESVTTEETNSPSVGLVTGVTKKPDDSRPSRPTSLPRGWVPSTAARTSFEKRFGRDIDIDLSLARFVGYYVEHSEKTSRDWTAKLAQWLAKDVADVRERRPDPNGPDENGIPKWLHKRMNGPRQEPA